MRSEWPHAVVVGIDAADALADPSVHGVYSLADLERWGAGKLSVGWVLPGQKATANDLLASDRVRYVGDPIAVVVADSRPAAEEAAQLVVVRYEPMPPVADVDHALEADAPLLYEGWGDNVLARTSVEAGNCDRAFAEAAVVVGDRFHVGRAACAPLEPRGAVASYDAARDEVTLVSSTQCPHHVRGDLAECLGRPERSIHVIAPDVGGSFGAKDHACAPEAILCLLALRLRRPVRWIEERSENLASTGHSREQILEVELAADDDGRAVALRGRLFFDVGAYSTTHGMGTALYALSLLPGPYSIEHYRLDVAGVMTNKAPSGAYRGYGAPEACFAVEGLMERLARCLNLDPVELRRRNLVQPDRFPYRTASGLTYDTCDLPVLLDAAVDASGYEQHRKLHPAEQRSDERGIREGMGLACSVLMGGFGPSEASLEAGMRYGGYEAASVRMDADGLVCLFTGLSSQGQGLDTTLGQICAEALGVDPERDVTVVAGDTAITPYSPVGPIASRGVAVGGSAVFRASTKLAETVKLAASEMLECAPEDVELAAGGAGVRGVPGRRLPLADVTRAIKQGRFQDKGVEPALESVASFEPEDQTYSFAVHVAKVRLDAETGRVEVSGYWAASDCGYLVNPAIVEGQMVGGIVQGLGGALSEEMTYGNDGQLLSGSFLDYGVPSSVEAPAVTALFQETPTPRTPTGARGAGELGIIGPAAAVAAAVADALGPDCGFPARTPITPERVWRLCMPEGLET